MTEPAFLHEHRVTYAHCTAGNHVYYGRYLDILEVARNEFFRNIGAPCLNLQEQDTTFPVIDCRLTYKLPARFDDLLKVSLWVTAAEGVRLSFCYVVADQRDQVVLKAETCHVCATVEGKPKRLPETLLVLLRPHLPGGQ